MKARFLRLAVLANVLLLAFPPGLCGALPVLVGQPRVEPAGCCQPLGEERASDPARLPDHSPDACCCHRQATSVPLAGQPLDMPGAALPARTVLVEPLGQRGLRLQWSGLWQTAGPALHVLHCVWRC